MLSETLKRDTQRAARTITAALASALILAGAIYTGIHNFNLFARYLPEEQTVFALIPVLLLEGSLLLLLIAQFTWLVAPAQRIIATVASWALFAIIAANTLLDSATQAGSQPPAWLSTYATLMLPITPVAVVATWKLIIDADPARRRAAARATLEAAIEAAQHEATLAALDQDDITRAIADYRTSTAALAAARIRASAPGSGSPPPKINPKAARPASPAMNGVAAGPAGPSGA